MSRVIVINGRRYDSVTGKLVSEATQKSSKTTAKKSADTHKRTSTHRTKSATRSTTLMRSAVKKPKPSAKPTNMSGIQRSQLGVSPARKRAAKNTAQSPAISKFSAMPSSLGIVKKIQHLPVRQQAASQSRHPDTTQSTHKTRAAKVGKAASRSSVAKKNLAASKLIDSALDKATSHKQTYDHPTRRRHKIARRLGVSARAVAISSTVLAGVLLGGFYAVQNVPNLSMRVAATRAGFDAKMPGYNPSGFRFDGPISYSSGQVVISFRSNVDSRAYSLTQRVSNWNSEALLENFVLADNQQFQTYRDKGRTLYIYNQSNATWVDNGIWYQVEGDSDMTTDQLIRLAASL